MNAYPPRALLVSWLALLTLLGITIFVSYQPIGSLNLPVAVGIAILIVLIIAAVFMELREQKGMIVAFACAGFFWLGILLWLAGVDYFTRSEFPPTIVGVWGSSTVAKNPAL